MEKIKLGGKLNFCIGIAGGTGSGKTTVAKYLQKQIGEKQCLIVEQDSYYKDRSNVPLDMRSQINYDHPDAIDVELFELHLNMLKRNQTILKPSYDFVTHTRSHTSIKVEPASVILVEGILIFAISEIRNLFDLKIFVDTESDLRFIRRLQRDIKERGRTLESVIQQYQESVRPMHESFVEPSKKFADLIIPEGGYNESALEVIVSRIKNHIESIRGNK